MVNLTINLMRTPIRVMLGYFYSEIVLTIVNNLLGKFDFIFIRNIKSHKKINFFTKKIY